MNRQAVARELVAVARGIIRATITDTSTLVVGLGEKPVDPSTGAPLEELQFTPKVEFSVVTQGTDADGIVRFGTDLHFNQFSPDRRYYWGRDATTFASRSVHGPLIYMPKHWDDYSAEYIQRIEKALRYHFPISRGVRAHRLAPPYHTWVEYMRKPIHDFGTAENFGSRDVRAIFKALRAVVPS